MVEIHTYPEMNAKIKDLLRIGEQPICLYAAKRIEELEEYERKKGEWLEDFNGFETIYRCSKCSEEPLTKYGTMHDYVLSEFCPHCGADMRGETTDGEGRNMIPTREQLEEAKHVLFHTYGHFTAFCNLNRSCEECDRIIRFGCAVKRKIEELQTKRILHICKSEPPKEKPE